MKAYYNGPIVTMEDDMPQAELLIEDQGKIIYVGDKASAKIPENVEWVDLKGHTLMPAFIDGHGHFSNTAVFLKTALLQSAESYDDIVRLMKNYQENHKNENLKAIIGMGYDHNFLKEGAHPTKYVLDQVSTDKPVIIIHTSMHMAVANSKLLELAGFSKDTPEIPGGVIDRDENGEPIGLLEEMAMHAVLPLIGNIFAGGSEDDLEKAQDLYIENGILTIQEGAANADNVNLTRKLAAEGRLKCDIVSYPCFTMGDGKAKETLHANMDCVNKYVNRFKIGGYKLVLDGSPQCKTAWLTQPYEGEENYCGYPWVSDEEVQEYVDIALDDGLQLLTHCNGDASGDQFLNAYEKSLARFPEGDLHHQLRPVMIHCQTARNDQLDRMAKMNMIASIFVAHVNYWGDVHLKNLGPVRGPHISPVKDALDRGIIVNFHTDTPVTMPYMLHSIWAAVNRVTRGGQVLGADQRIDVWEAMKAVTINAAYSYFEENEKGSLKVGKKADLIILDQNPLTVDKMAIKDIKVLSSIKEGEVLYQAK
ncbi:MAG: amidohydrolase [Peptococcaceae bacterium]|nr:amidohydrolase [Peptococcaceae bacterium]